MNEDFDKDEWGNIELPGLSDEELFETKWSLKKTNKDKELKRQAMLKYWQNEENKKAHHDALMKYVNSEEYVNPKGMLGKTRSKESREKASKSLYKKCMPKTANDKLSKYHTGRKKSKKSIEKMKQSLTGRETGRSRKVQTPHGVFDKLRDAASYYGVTNGSIKNWVNKTTTTITKVAVREKLIAKGVELDENNFPIGFSWVDSSNLSYLPGKKIQTPDGIFTLEEASKYYGVSKNAISYRVNKWHDWHYIEQDT